MEYNKHDNAIFIASSSVDRPEFEPVSNILLERGYDVIEYEADAVARAEKHLSIELDSDGEIILNYDQKNINLNNIGAAWYRRPSMVYFDMPDKAKQYNMVSEIQELQGSIWQQIHESKWLNSPERIFRIEKKLAQLALANSFGFSTPETVVSNDWDTIRSKFTDDNFIAKMSKGLLYENNVLKTMYTQIIHQDDVEDLSATTVPYPAFFQPYLQKTREWRVTVVGDDTFEAAIYVDDTASDDWRLHQESNSVRFSKEYIADNIREKCVDFLKHLGLRFGAYDFIEDNEGRITYLELNPNGQFGWLEDRLDMPISEAISDELAANVEQSSS